MPPATPSSAQPKKDKRPTYARTGNSPHWSSQSLSQSLGGKGTVSATSKNTPEPNGPKPLTKQELQRQYDMKEIWGKTIHPKNPNTQYRPKSEADKKTNTPTATKSFVRSPDVDRSKYDLNSVFPTRAKPSKPTSKP